MCLDHLIFFPMLTIASCFWFPTLTRGEDNDKRKALRVVKIYVQSVAANKRYTQSLKLLHSDGGGLDNDDRKLV